MNVALAAGDSREHEYHAQEEIQNSMRDGSGLVVYLSTFPLRGRDSNHRALVFPLRCLCLDSHAGREIPMASRMSATEGGWAIIEKLTKGIEVDKGIAVSH
ncbi:hypothetical protein MGYG_01899 [Nannizzia gypsea CBS 118893]|uniref:Uncharacterized protein n=1 Tax=Arthroderma gypseum (strain ATCC MYA-4604 / CBS 118893) TaxID=535722 RepID=E5QYM2_ARTGP|nr:hypothetical protein MGYG_01899 [Nannizzia gypsea CBS 118893]EFQ98885.1 hypothetical protein MGYG_01899 [Nannizzia gypsea CBS 118893]